MKRKRLVWLYLIGLATITSYVEGQRFDDTQSGLPGWGKTGKDAISRLTVIRVDLSISFLDAMYVFTNRAEIARIGTVFEGFAREPEAPPEYDEKGNLVVREDGSGMVTPIYQILVTQERQQRLFYLTVERGTPQTSVTATLWTLRPDGMFIKYASCTYEGLAEGEDPPPLKLLAVMCPPRPKRQLKPPE